MHESGRRRFFAAICTRGERGGLGFRVLGVFRTQILSRIKDLELKIQCLRLKGVVGAVRGVSVRCRHPSNGRPCHPSDEAVAHVFALACWQENGGRVLARAPGFERMISVQTHDQRSNTCSGFQRMIRMIACSGFERKFTVLRGCRATVAERALRA